uniref:Uncharacterized protein n=1 Tax=Glossina brevipalpis TaxID=37001 RepID=A0A1A9WEI9_9MUSC
MYFRRILLKEKNTNSLEEYMYPKLVKAALSLLRSEELCYSISVSIKRRHSSFFMTFQFSVCLNAGLCCVLYLVSETYLGASFIKASLPKSSPLLSVATVPLPCITTSTDPLSIIYHERPSSP